MSDISILKDRYDIPGAVVFSEGKGGLPRVTLTAGEAEAEIYLNGACVTRYDVGGRPVLFTSRTSKFEAGKAIRGGVPIIFPWFGPHPSDPKPPQHGFARAAAWSVESTLGNADGQTGGAEITLKLVSSDTTRAVWPVDFELRFTVNVGKRLDMALAVTNTGGREFSFEEALHTYLAVSDVRNIRITGLENTDYIDKVEGGMRKRQGDAPVVLSGETDRVFLNTRAECTVEDPQEGRTIVSKEGSQSTVVWNPWEAKAEGLADMAGGQWPGMVCVETANAMENAVTLAPGATHVLRAMVARASKGAATEAS